MIDYGKLAGYIDPPKHYRDTWHNIYYVSTDGEELVHIPPCVNTAMIELKPLQYTNIVGTEVSYQVLAATTPSNHYVISLLKEKKRRSVPEDHIDEDYVYDLQAEGYIYDNEKMAGGVYYYTVDKVKIQMCRDSMPYKIYRSHPIGEGNE